MPLITLAALKLAAAPALGILRAVPWQAWAAAAAIGAAWWWHDGRVDAAYAAGEAAAGAECAAARQETDRLASRARALRIEVAASASAGHEAVRAQITQRLPESRHAVRQALAAPVACPVGRALAVGDVVLPADALRGVRNAGAAVPGATRD
jgi:hypothetical protein